MKQICELARAKGIETIVDGAHSYAQFDFNRKILAAITSARACTSGSTLRKEADFFT